MEGVEGIIAGSAIGLVSGVLAAVLLAHVLMRGGAAGRPGLAATAATGTGRRRWRVSAWQGAPKSVSCPHSRTWL